MAGTLPLIKEEEIALKK